jgi:hypothetical protein
MTKYISFDPGETTGIAEWLESGELKAVHQLDQMELDDFLKTLESEPPEIFIMEEYRVFGHVNHTGSKIPTVQTIGQIKAFARRYSIEIIEQKEGIRKIAAMWSQTKIPKGHMPDWMSASWLLLST